TLADCIASRILTGRPPHVLQAITFEPKDPQSGLQSVCVAGRTAYQVNPIEADFYRTVIDLRSEVQQQLDFAQREGSEDAARLDSEQLALKILANATSYGIFVEVNVEDLESSEMVCCYGANEQPFSVQTTRLERPGTYFHPVLATLITGAA